MQPLCALRVMTHLQQRMAVVGNGNIDVGNQTPIRSPDQSIVERLVGSDESSEPRIDKPLQTGTIGICGAMSLQGGDGGRGNESVPQKFVHLVGCHDAKAAKDQVTRRPH